MKRQARCGGLEGAPGELEEGDCTAALAVSEELLCSSLPMRSGDQRRCMYVPPPTPKLRGGELVLSGYVSTSDSTGRCAAGGRPSYDDPRLRADKARGSLVRDPCSRSPTASTARFCCNTTLKL